MEAHRSPKSGGNWRLKKGKIGSTGKDTGILPGKALLAVREGRAPDKRVPLFSRFIAKVL